MKKLSTSVAEQVYDILIKFANAKSDYLFREEFIFHFSLVEASSTSFKLTCVDDSPRTFICTNPSDMKLIGRGEERVNAIFSKLNEI